MKFEHATLIEAMIAQRIVEAALEKGWTVSVNDGGEWVVEKGTDYDVITDAMNSTGEDILKFRKPDGEVVGTVVLIWGNDRDVISDYSSDDNGFDEFMEMIYLFAENY